MSEFKSFWRLSGNRDIADDFGGNDAPKLKFNFTVQFILNRDLASLPHTGSNDMDKIRFACKSATRPKPTIEYADVNFYNFRTKVATRMDQGTASISFYDDNNNLAHSIIENYLKTVSPIYSATEGQSGSFDSNGQGSAASIGPLSKNRHGAITAIRVSHHYYNKGPKKITYSYLNPKITTPEFDDLDMSISEANMINITFNYDSVEITKE